MQNKGIIGAIVTGFLIILSLIIFFTCTERVPAGHRGILYRYNAGVTGETVGEGLRFVGPATEIVVYSVGIEQSYLTSGKEGDSPNNDSFEVPSSDGKGLIVDLTFTYRYDENQIADIFKRFKGRNGKEIRDEFIKPSIISWVKEITAQYPVTEILGEKRAELNKAVADYVKAKFEPYGIIIENASLINIDADPDTRAQVQRRVNALQELELAQTEKKTAQVKADQEKEVALTKAQQEKEAAIIKAEQEKETATIDAERAKIEAEGKAEAIEIKAAAEAKKNKMIAESLTPDLIELTKYQAWNGKLPSITGNGSNLIIDTEDFMK